MTHISLFSGIGGIDLAAHWAGFETIQFVERDPFCQRVLTKNFKGVPIHDDITTFDGRPFAGRVDLLSGGFPCQDVSQAGKRKGVGEETRSGLYREVIRIARETQPRWIILENVAGLITGGGIGTVLADLSQSGYSAVWVTVNGEMVGYPITRERVFIIAYTSGINGLSLLETLHSEFSDSHKGSPKWTPDVARISVTPFRRTFLVLAGLLRGYYGVPRCMDSAINESRCRALGNAVHPKVAYPILKAIAEASK